MWKISSSKDWEFLFERFSYLQDMEGVPQDPIFHAEGDVAVHTRMVVEALLQLPAYQQLPEQEQEILFAAALLHDVEKRSTTHVDGEGRIRSPGHAKRGMYTTRRLLYEEHAPSFAIKEMVARLVRYHGLPLWVFDKPDPRKALLQASLEVDTRLLGILARADVLGRICADQDELLYRIDLFEAYCQEQQCYGQAAAFGSDAGRYHYFQQPDASPDYVPYEEKCFEVVLLSALPGSGKDRLVRQDYKDWPMVSIDDLRRKHGASPTNKKQNGRMVQLAKEQARVFLRARRSFVWNATNTSRSMRKQLIDLFQSYGALTHLVYVEVPYKQLLHQNANRPHPVPRKALQRMIARLEVPVLWEAPRVSHRTY